MKNMKKKKKKSKNRTTELASRIKGMDSRLTCAGSGDGQQPRPITRQLNTDYSGFPEWLLGHADLLSCIGPFLYTHWVFLPCLCRAHDSLGIRTYFHRDPIKNRPSRRFNAAICTDSGSDAGHCSGFTATRAANPSVWDWTMHRRCWITEVVEWPFATAWSKSRAE